jgi:hypothetical protein
MNFEELKSKWNWMPIRNCPGRFICRENNRNISPQDLIGVEIQFREFQSKNAKDTVIIGRFIDGGLISYRKNEGTYLHTLNTIDGFERKLSQLGIKL